MTRHALLMLSLAATAGCPPSKASPHDTPPPPAGKARSNAKTPFVGKVISIADGDTVTVLHHGRRRKIRLHGVDCPERHQAYGNKAKQLASSAVFGKQVRVEPVATDRYGRVVARVCPQDGGRCLGERLVAEGLAWWYRRYAPKATLLGRLEAEARKARKGLWADAAPVAPWTFRRQRRGKSAAPPIGPRPTRIGALMCNAGSKVCHAARCKHYRCKRCTIAFDSLGQARKAGYRPHAACVGTPP